VNEASQILKPSGTDLDLDALKARLRHEAALARKAAIMPGPSDEVPAFNWVQVQASLSNAARLAPAPTEVPSLGRFRGLTRRLVQLVMRGFLSLARVVTVRQGDCNARLIEALRATAEGLRNLERQVAQQHERLRRMEAVLGREEGRRTAS
jgi:hypothetical protein